MARIALIAPALARLKRNATRAAIGIGLVVAFGGLALTYLLIALRHVLEREIGPLWTPLAIAGTLLIAALVAYLALLRPRRPSHPTFETQATGLPPDLAAPVHNLEAKVARNPLPSIALAVLAGFAAASLLRVLRRSNGERSRTTDSGRGAEEVRPRAAEEPPRARTSERRKGNGRGASV